MLTMKNLTLLLLLYCLSVQDAGGQTTAGDSLWNWAVSGLKLKERPAVNSKRIAGIPFGEKVRVVEDTVPAVAFVQLTCKSRPEKQCFSLKGNWLKVEYAGKTGYVFDFYLSSFPVLGLTKAVHSGEQEGPNDFDRLKFYIKKNFGLGGIKKYKDKEEAEHVIANFGRDIEMKRRFHGHDFEEIELRLPGWKFNEAYLLANVIFMVESDGFFLYKQTGNSLHFKNEGQGVLISTDASGSRISFGSYD